MINSNTWNYALLKKRNAPLKSSAKYILSNELELAGRWTYRTLSAYESTAANMHQLPLLAVTGLPTMHR